MLNIPAIYKNNNEDYITLPAIKAFIKARPQLKIKSSATREALMEGIIQYGNESDEKAEDVLNWIDETIREGIKDVHLQYSELPYEITLLFSSLEKISAYLNSHLRDGVKRHICNNTYSNNLTLLNATVVQTDLGRKIEFTYCIKLHLYDKKKMITKAIDYPIIAEYYVDKYWLLTRAKPRSNLYSYNPEGFSIEKSVTTTTEKQIMNVADSVGDILNLKNSDIQYTSRVLKNKIFNLLDKYSKTPEEILKVMEDKAENICHMASLIKTMCSVPPSMNNDVDDDIKNIVEKYLSINWQSKDVFIKNRDAYPIKLSATDEEESKVEQTAALSEPLQAKALFFDNKKMLYKNQSCDGVVLKWKRIIRAYYSNDAFPVRISANSKGNCVFKFTEYTSREDIDNVIFSIIGVN